MGIIAGDGAGKFNPEGTLTASQTAKMFLTAMGYNANVFGFTGTNWEVNTNRYANEAGLYEELGDVSPSDPISRDDAAQMAYNAIQATMMHRTWSQDMATGQLTETYDLWVDTDGFRHTLLGEKSGAYVAYGQLISVNKVRLTIETDHNYDSKATSSARSFSKLADDYSGLLGETVRVIFKETDNVLAVIPEDSNIVYNVNRADVTQDKSNVKFGGDSYSMENMTWTHGNTPAITEAANRIDYIFVNKDGVASVADKTSADFAANRSSFNTVKFVDNDDDGVLEYAVEWEVIPGKVTYASSSEIIAGGTTYKLADNNVADGIERDDYVSATYNVFNANYDVVELEMGTAAAAINNKTGADLQYMFDDVWYYRGSNNLTDNVQAGSTYDYWTCNGVIVDTKLNTEGTSLSNLVMVIRTDNTGIEDRAKVIYTNGDVATLDVVPDSYSNGDVNYDDLNDGDLYTVTETSKGYSFKALEDDDKIGNHTYTDGGVVNGGPISTVGGEAIADDAVVFVYTSASSGDGKVLNGKQLKNETAGTSSGNIDTAATGYFTNKVDGLTRVSVAAVKMYNGGTLPEGTANYDNFALIVSDAYTLVDSDYFTYEIWDGESMYRVRERGTLGDGERKQFDVITYNSVDEDDIISDVVELTQVVADADGDTDGNLSIAPVYSTSNNKMWVSNTTGLDLTDNTVYMYYDSSKTAAAEIGKAEGSLIKADPAANGVLTPNVKYIGDGNDVVFVLIDVTNKIVDSQAQNAYAMTAPVINNFNGVTGAKVEFSSAEKIITGGTLTMTITTDGTALPAGTLSLSNAVFADTGASTYSFGGLNTKSSIDISIVANGGANAVISVSYSGLSTSADAAAINGALNSGSSVTIPGAYSMETAGAGITVPATKTLTIDGALTLGSTNTLTVNGELVVDSIADLATNGAAGWYRRRDHQRHQEVCG